MKKEYIVYIKNGYYEFRNDKGYLEFTINDTVSIEKLKQMYSIKAVV